MKSGRAICVLLLMLVILCSSIAFPNNLKAEPRAEAFLAALKSRGYYDTAIEYLERLRNDKSCPAALKQTIDYEIGMANWEGFLAARTLKDQNQFSDAALAAMQRFLADQPKHPLVSDVHMLVGDILMQQGLLILSQGELPGQTDEDRRLYRTQARPKFDEAQKQYQQAEKLFYDRAKELEKTVQEDASLNKQFDTVKENLLQSRLSLARITEEIGKTYEPGSKEYKDRLKSAADQYHTLFVKYSTMLAGLYAKLYEARCRLLLGDPDEAKKLVQELTVVDTRPDLMHLKLESLDLIVDINNDPKILDYADSMRRLEGWQNAVSGAIETSMQGLKLHLKAGKTALAYARSMKQKDANYRTMIGRAKAHLELVSRLNSPYRSEAGTILTEPEFGLKIDPTAEVKTFDEAVEKAEFAFNTMIVTLGKISAAETTKQKNELTQQMHDARDEAIAMYRSAIHLADENTAIEALNSCRFRLAYLYFMRDDLYDAAVLSESLSRNYPQSDGARAAAEIAVKAYRKLFLDARDASEDTDFADQHLQVAAAYLMKNYPGSQEADEACLMLIDTAIDKRQINEARDLLTKIDEASPRRGQAELRLGQMLWSNYVDASKLPESERPTQQELATMVDTSQAMLTQGINRIKKSLSGAAPDYMTVYAVLSLAQIAIDRGNPAEAVKWLNDSQVGPVALVKNNSPVIANDNSFKISAYMAALRAYVGTQQLDEAEKAMNSLEKLVESDDGDSGKRLTQIYIYLGRQLEELLGRLHNEGKTQEMADVSRAFESFLKRIAERSEGTTFSSLNWVAETYYSLGSGLDQGGSTSSEAKAYYVDAAKTYKAMLEKADADPSWAPEGAKDIVAIRLASCIRALGSPEKAMPLLLRVLKENSMRVDAQMEAARTYEAWGSQDPENYYKAIVGGEQQEDGSYLLWGWNGIARRVASHEKYRDIFFESMYRKNVSRLRYAQSLAANERKTQLDKAELDIRRTYQSYPEMGGPEWFKKYDVLLRAVRKLKGNPDPKGLKE